MPDKRKDLMSWILCFLIHGKTGICALKTLSFKTESNSCCSVAITPKESNLEVDIGGSPTWSAMSVLLASSFMLQKDLFYVWSLAVAWDVFSDGPLFSKSENVWNPDLLIRNYTVWNSIFFMIGEDAIVDTSTNRNSSDWVLGECWVTLSRSSSQGQKGRQTERCSQSSEQDHLNVHWMFFRYRVCERPMLQDLFWL